MLQRWHNPERRGQSRILQLRADVPIVVVIAGDATPEARRRERRVIVHALKGAPPPRFVRRAHAVKIEVIAERKHEGAAVPLGGLAHGFGDLDLSRRRPWPHWQAAPIGDGEKVEIGVGEWRERELEHNNWWATNKLCIYSGPRTLR